MFTEYICLCLPVWGRGGCWFSLIALIYCFKQTLCSRPVAMLLMKHCSRSHNEECLSNNCRDHSSALLCHCTSCSIHGFTLCPARLTQLRHGPTRRELLHEIWSQEYYSVLHLLMGNIWMWFCFVFFFFKNREPFLAYFLSAAEILHSWCEFSRISVVQL